MLFVLQLPSADSSMLVQTDTGGVINPHSLFASPFPAVKSFDAIGSDLPYVLEFSSLSQSSPLVYLSPADTSSCPGCCSSFAPSSSLPLSPPVSSLVANKTVVMKCTEVSTCAPRVDTVTGFETMITALEQAGASAVVMVTFAKVPGVSSNLVGSFVSASDRRAAKASQIPFVSIGSEFGEKLVKAVQEEEARSSVQNNNPDSDLHRDLHVKFTFDDNEFLVLYHSYFEVPFKVISFLVVTGIIHRCRTLGLKLSPTTNRYLGVNLPLLSSTKNLVVLMALLVAAAIMTMVSLNGMMLFDEKSTGSVLYTAGTMLPCLNLSSTVLIGRFWNTRHGRHDGAASTDPAKTHPVTTLLIVSAGLSGDLFLSIYSVSASHDPRPAIQLIYILMTVCYFFATLYFFYAGGRVLRSLNGSLSTDRRTRAMAFYLITVAVFTLMINISALTIATEIFLESAGQFFVYASFFLGGSYGSTLCQLFVFTARKDGGGGGDAGDGEAGGDETFLEAENRVLAERNSSQTSAISRRDSAISRLESEASRIRERADLETRLHETEHKAVLSAVLLEAEKKARVDAQAEKSSFLAAIHGEKET